MTPEEKARQQIDAMLTASGWVVQTKASINLSAQRGVAICELTFATGEPDYTLFVDGKALGTVEAKPAGHSLVGVEEQSTKYVFGVPFGLPAWKSPLPFCYESTGTETFFTIPEVKSLVEGALRHFDGQRYRLHEFVVAPNHVHVLVSPSGEHTLSEILHSWKSFTAHEILKVAKSGRAVPALSFENNTVWQKESFDHIVRSPASMEKFRTYIREHGSSQNGSGVPPLSYSEPTAKQRRDAAATLIKAALAPLATNPDLRNLLKKIAKAADQTIDIISRDTLIYAGPAQTSTQNNAEIAKSFREYIEQHRAEITALQILYSRPFKQRLTEPMLKELEKKLRDNHAAWTEDNLWNAFAAAKPGKVKGRSQAGRFADLVSLVRFALEQQPVLAPFADSVSERFNEWLMDKAKAGVKFSAEQLAWLNLIRDHIATAISIEPEDLELSPFNQRGGLGKAHQLFGEQLPKLLAELNEVLAA
jgi:type I site-specific restriction endonuclease